MSFSKKSKLNTNSMMHLVFQTGKEEITNAISILNDSKALYNREMAEINCISIIYELCRYELYKNNNKEIVDNVMDKVYEQFYFDVNSNIKDNVKIVVDEVIRKMNEIFTQDKLLAPKENFVYRLFLEQLAIKESSLANIYIQKLIYLSQRWILMAEGIDKSYYIEDTPEEIKQNKAIDYRF